MAMSTIFRPTPAVLDPDIVGNWYRTIFLNEGNVTVPINGVSC